MKKIEIQVPSLGESITEATSSKMVFKKGDKVKKDEYFIRVRNR